MSKVLADVNVLGSFTSADDVVAPLDARGFVLIHECGRLLSDAKSFQKGYEIQDLSTSRRCGVVLGLERIFDFHMICALLYNMSVPDVDHIEQLFPQSASA